MIRVVYTSKSKVEWDSSSFLALLTKSRIFNHGKQVGGILLFSHSTQEFLQVIEGPEAAVDGLYTRIETDPRHASVRLLVRAEAETRSFSQWDMGFSLSADLGDTSEWPDAGFIEMPTDVAIESAMRVFTVAKQWVR